MLLVHVVTLWDTTCWVLYGCGLLICTVHGTCVQWNQMEPVYRTFHCMSRPPLYYVAAAVNSVPIKPHPLTLEKPGLHWSSRWWISWAHCSPSEPWSRLWGRWRSLSQTGAVSVSPRCQSSRQPAKTISPLGVPGGSLGRTQRVMWWDTPLCAGW